MSITGLIDTAAAWKLQTKELQDCRKGRFTRLEQKMVQSCRKQAVIDSSSKGFMLR